jgi:hypothetical protein
MLRDGESPAEVEATWLRRREELLTLGSRFFDENLNQLPCATLDAALEVRLVCEPDRGLQYARCEVRTRLAMSARLMALIESVQRELAGRWGLRFAEPGTLKPHVLIDEPRRLVRGYGARNVFDLNEEASVLVRAYWFLADLWRVASIGRTHVRLTFMRWFAEHVVAVHDRWDLFDPRQRGTAPNDGRPGLTDELLARIGRALGFVEESGGRYRKSVEPDVATAPPRTVLRLVAEELAERRGIQVDSVMRKVLEPMLRGELNGVVVLLTKSEARAVRGALRERCQEQSMSLPEK